MKRYLVFLMAILLVIVSIDIAVIAQQGDQQRRLSRRFTLGIDPEKLSEKLIEERVRLVLKRMELSEEESNALRPKLMDILKLRLEQAREMRSLANDLQKAIESNDDEQISAKLAELKLKRNEHRILSEARENELIKSLKVKQEAQLTVFGIINRDDATSLAANLEMQERQETSEE